MSTRALTGLFLAGTLAGCGDPASPAGLFASFGIAPVLAPGTLPGVVNVDNARLRLFRTASVKVIDTVVVFPAESSKVTVVLRVPLLARSERMLLMVELRVGGQPYYHASELVELFAEAQGPTPTPRPVVTYVGPGAAARQLQISPRDTILTFGDPFTFRVTATDSIGGSVTDLLLLWNTAPFLSISNTGTLLAPSARGIAKVRVLTPAGIGDSTSVRFVPAPAALVAQGGAGQIAPAGTVLANPFVVQVRGPDGLPVPGVTVRFRALTAGGAVRDLSVVSDDSGLAGTVLTLGASPGVYGFEASVAGLPVVVVNALAQ